MISILKNLKPNISISRFGKQKAILAFEFAVVLSDTAHELGVSMNKEMILRAEDLIMKELGGHTAEHFACNMSVYALAILEPMEIPATDL